MKRLSGKTALIVGATSGIGAECARLFAAEGAQVVITGRRAELGEAVVKEIVDLGGEAFFFSMEATKEDEVEAAVAETVKRYGKLDIAVNTPGRGPSHFVTEMTAEAWHEIIDVNLTCIFYCIKHQARQMKKNGGGSIINLSSNIALTHSIAKSAYCAGKAGLDALTKVSAMELGPDNIRVNAILPGFTSSERVGKWLENPAVYEEVVYVTPTKKVSTPRDVAYMALYLASDESANVSAAQFVIDGGAMQVGTPEVVQILMGLPRRES